MKYANIIPLLLIAACAVPTSNPQPTQFRMAECPPGCVCTCEPMTGTSAGATDSGGTSESSSTSLQQDSSSGSASSSPATSSSSSSAESSDGGSSSSGGAPVLSYDCPASIQFGLNTFTGAGLNDRVALIEQYGTGGLLTFHWYGTNGTIANVLPWGSAAATRAMAAADGGIFVVPERDDAAVVRPNGNIFPWWVVGDADAPEEEVDRPDDFLLMDAIVGCLDGQYDPDRITSGGASAGAIMSTHLADRRDYLAGIVSWSGGMPFGASMTPEGDVAAMVIHGGEPDQYCGPGVTECYDFLEPSTNLALDMVAAGHFAFLCDFGEGRTVPPFNPGDTHTDAMANEGAEFLRLANRTGHPWETYPIGPDFPNGALWMLDHYCYTTTGPHADWGQ